MKNYLVKLKPLAPFFFGSEKNFGDGTNANYFAKSNLFPQQTTVLGMIRKELLIQFKDKGFEYREKWSEYSPEDITKMKELIGPASFKIGCNNNFGKIKKISPVFLASKNDFLTPTPNDSGFSFKTIEGRSNINEQKKFIPMLCDYKAKDGLKGGFVPFKGGQIIKSDNIFHRLEKVGNATDKSEDDKEKFFKQLFYVMGDSYSFAFFVQIDFTLNSEAIVYMGADNSSFKMTCEERNSSFEKLFIDQKSEIGKVTLLSDALVDEDIYNFCKFAVTETIDFRSIVMEKGSFKNRDSKYIMLKRGSVFFTDDENRLKGKIKNNQLEQIGYNICR